MKTNQTVEKKEEVNIKSKNPLSIEPFLKWKYKFNEETGRNEFHSIELSDGTKPDMKTLFEELRRATGATNPEVGEKILSKMSRGLIEDEHSARLNELSTLLPSLKPQDEMEALLLGQFLALQDSGMNCLRNANSQSMFYHIEKLFNLSTKLFNTANQTIQALLKYRSGGQQIVQVVHLHNEGQAIVAQTLSPPKREGVSKKNKE